jgi:hypothetical protein
MMAPTMCEERSHDRPAPKVTEQTTTKNNLRTITRRLERLVLVTMAHVILGFAKIEPK